MAADTVESLEARLAAVRAAIDTALLRGVAEFEHEGGDRVQLLSLETLRKMELDYVAQLGAARRKGARFVGIRMG